MAELETSEAPPIPEKRTLVVKVGPEGPTMEGLRAGLHRIAAEDGEWAGYPMPVRGAPLVMEPRFPHRGVNGMSLDEEEPTTPEKKTAMRKAITAVVDILLTQPENEGLNRYQMLRKAMKKAFPTITVVNRWYSAKRHATVEILRVNGEIKHTVMPCYGGPKLSIWVSTMMASDAWTVEMEENAMRKLKSLLRPHQYESYFLTGTFLEKSKKSGMFYMFRKLKPTIAMRAVNGDMRVSACLCLHPQGYYAGTWAGVMTPTDDVICHLIMMRGSEKRFWSKAVHHEYHEPEAGL